MTNYTIINNADITNLKISDGAYRCYNLLLSMCYGEKNFCFPSIKYIAIALGRSCRTINRYIKELCKAGLISRRRRGSLSNIYYMLQKKVQQTAAKVVNKVKNAYKGKKKNVFCDYPQRTYDFTELEKKLLGTT